MNEHLPFIMEIDKYILGLKHRTNVRKILILDETIAKLGYYNRIPIRPSE